MYECEKVCLETAGRNPVFSMCFSPGLLAIIPPPKKKGGVFVCLIPLRVEQSWQGDFLSLARNFSWMHYARAENRKGVEEPY
jgi:hypothetical protein